MKGKVALAAILFFFATAVLAWWNRQRCARACDDANYEAETLFQKGDFLSALTLIDQVDTRCNCSRFTSGDMPPEYSLAQACLRQLLNKGQDAEIHFILARTRSPILMELRKST
jgi:hypothetical protein